MQGMFLKLGVKFSLHNSDTVSHRISSGSVSYSITLTVQGMTAGLTTPDPANLTSEKHLINSASQQAYSDQNNDLIKVSRTMKRVRVLGLMAVISYMVVILFAWIYTNLDGYVYFLAGEPNPLIKYLEWALGFTGIFVAVDFLRKEINETA